MKKLAIVILAITLSGCDAEKFGRNQSLETKAICDVNSQSGFVNCVDRKFPTGSSYLALKGFLLDSGFQYYEARDSKGCHYFEWQKGDMTPTWWPLSIHESQNVILNVRISGKKSVKDHC